MTAPEQPSLQATRDTLEALAEVMAGQLTTGDMAELLGDDLATGTLGVAHTLLSLLALKLGISPTQAMTLAVQFVEQAQTRAVA